MEEKPTTQIHSTPSLSGRAAGGASTIHYTLPEVVPYINWLYFFHAWGFPARFAAIAQIHGCDSCRASWLTTFPVEERAKAAEAMQLHKEAMRMLGDLDRQGFKTHVRFGLFPCNSDGEDIIIDEYPQSSINNHQSPIINHQSSIINHQSSIINIPSPSSASSQRRFSACPTSYVPSTPKASATTSASLPPAPMRA